MCFALKSDKHRYFIYLKNQTDVEKIFLKSYFRLLLGLNNRIKLIMLPHKIKMAAFKKKMCTIIKEIKIPREVMEDSPISILGGVCCTSSSIF
eukprot:UN28323